MSILVALAELTLTLQCDGVATYGSRTEPGRARVEIVDGAVRVRPPDLIAPDVAGRGNDGWRDLQEVVISETEITGRYSYNWINKPKVRIDRRTGDIEIDARDVATGQAGFRGDCRPVTSERLF